MFGTSQEQITHQLHQIRAEGGMRSRRIGQILRTAFTETTTEVKIAASHLHPIAQDLTATVVNDVKQKSQSVSAQLNEAWLDQTEGPDLVAQVQRVLAGMGTALRALLLPWVQQRAQDLDTTLNERYGDRYSPVKQQMTQAFTQWISQRPVSSQTSTASPAAKPTPVEIEDEGVTLDAKVVQEDA